MSMPLTKEHFPTQLQRRRYPSKVIDRPKYREATSPSNKPSVSTGDEMAFLTKVIVIMTLIAVTPLAVMHAVLYFYPEVFMVPITPN